MQSENDRKMAKLFCALVGAAGNAFSVRVDEGDSVDELKKAIKGEKQRTITCDPDGLDLYLAKKGDAWLTENEVKGVSDIDGLKHLDVARAKLRRVGLSNDQVGEEDEDVDAAGNGPVNVLVLIPPEEEQPSHKKVKIVNASSVIKDEDINFIEKNLDIEVWQVGGGISLGIGRVESDFPEWFYVRKETLDIIQVFKDKMEAKLHIVFVGTPGVGKSMLVVLFAFYMALRQKKRVVLFRKKKGEGFSMLYLDTENNNCWRMDAAEIGDLDRQFLQGAELCLDGLRYDDIDRYFGKLGGFRLLATSVHYPMKNDDIPVLRRCLVPFWSSVDLNAIGAHLQWSKHEIKDRYFYSGGNLRDFLSEKIVVMDSIDQAVDLIDLPVAELLNTQYALDLRDKLIAYG